MTRKTRKPKGRSAYNFTLSMQEIDTEEILAIGIELGQIKTCIDIVAMRGTWGLHENKLISDLNDAVFLWKRYHGILETKQQWVWKDNTVTGNTSVGFNVNFPK